MLPSSPVTTRESTVSPQLGIPHRFTTNGNHSSLPYSENIDDFKHPKSASQAYDEGSIPFTRSNRINNLVDAESRDAANTEKCGKNRDRCRRLFSHAGGHSRMTRLDAVDHGKTAVGT